MVPASLYAGKKTEMLGPPAMIGALERLKAYSEPVALPDSVKTFGIRGNPGGFARLFASHPPLDERIARLQRRWARGR
jgi:heat shock protein HtpX